MSVIWITTYHSQIVKRYPTISGAINIKIFKLDAAKNVGPKYYVTSHIPGYSIIALYLCIIK